jgi:uncharacterized protein YjbI with pentapeptide repeats
MEMVAPALDSNPRRMKHFLNLFRFQKTIGFKTGLFSYKDGTDNTKPMWNCKKLAKFVAISIMWPSLISALSLNIALIDQLQQYALKPDNEKEKFGLDQKLPDKWIHDDKLITLLRAGCTEDVKDSKTKDEYSLLNLNFSKLLQISPAVSTLPSPKPPVSSSETPVSSSETFLSPPNNLTKDELVAWVSRQKHKLKKTNLEGVDLQGVDLQMAHLEEANLKEANLEGADISTAFLNKINLQGANLTKANLGDSNLRGANLQNAILQRANARYSNLVETDLRNADLQGARFPNANLQGANLEEANLKEANLEEASLEEANLQGANLQGANLQGANLQEANLQEAHNLSIDQLSKVKTLYNAKLDEELLKLLKEKYPILFV